MKLIGYAGQEPRGKRDPRRRVIGVHDGGSMPKVSIAFSRLSFE